MSSYSIIISKDNKDLFLMIWKKFEENFSLFKNVVINNRGDELKLEFDLAQKKETKTLELTKAWLADNIVLYYKTRYLENNLKLPPSMCVPFKAMCKALAVFDKLADVNYILSDLELTPELNVDSYYLFKLPELRLRWQEICDLFYTNLPELIASDAFVDLMRYLLSVCEPTTTKVYVSLTSELIYLKGVDGANLINPLPNNLEGKENLILELISLAPMSIYIKENYEERDFADNLKYLFDDKVVYCT